MAIESDLEPVLVSEQSVNMVLLRNLESEGVCVFSAVNLSPDQLERRNGTRLSAFLFM